MPTPQQREATIASLLAHGLTPEEIAEVVAQEAAFHTLRLARAVERRPPAPADQPSPAKGAKRSAKRSSAKRSSANATSAASTPAPAPPSRAAAPSEAAKTRYRVRNWKDYTASLVARGNLTIWFDAATLDHWLANERQGEVGRPTTYADTTILCALTLRELFHLPLRQTEGFVASLLHLLSIQLRVPDYTTLSRRAEKLVVTLPQRPKNEPLHLVVDSTGVKVYGEGEWKVRLHGFSKHRSWRKLHVGVDPASGEIVAQATTPSRTSDKAMLPALLVQVQGTITQVSADGGYDYHSCYEAVAAREAVATIPPRENAAHNEGEGWEQRNAAIDRIAEVGRKQWKRECGYHRRSLAETTMFRLKTIFGPALRSRQEARQKTEVAIRCAALNRMTHLGMPNSEPLPAA
jgi:IS5 family transposase